MLRSLVFSGAARTKHGFTCASNSRQSLRSTRWWRLCSSKQHAYYVTDPAASNASSSPLSQKVEPSALPDDRLKDHELEQLEREAAGLHAKITKLRNAPEGSIFRLRDRTWESFYGDLEKKVGTLITVPYVHTFLGIPLKDAPEGERSFEFLLTRPRLGLITEFMKSVRDSRRHQMIISGPNGVSKSTVIAVLAACAFYNDTFLLYIPDGHSLATSKDVGTFLCDRFLSLNEMHYQTPTPASSVPAGVTNVFRLIEHTNKTTTFDLAIMFNVLAKMNLLPVVIIDEHNELFREHVAMTSTLSTFTRPLAGPNMILILAGSAHSKFERTLQPALEKALRHLVRFTEEESVQLLFRGKLGQIPGQGQFDLVKKEVMHATGGIARELTKLSAYLLNLPEQIGDTAQLIDFVRNWRRIRSGQIADDAKKYLKMYPEFADELGRSLLDPTSVPDSTVWDRGLFIREPNGKYDVSSGVARDAYWSLLPKLAVDSRDPISFENNLAVALTNPTPRVLPLHDASREPHKLLVKLPGSTVRLCWPTTWKDFPDPLLDGTRTVFCQPKGFPWPTFDFYIHWCDSSTHHVICIQASTSSFAAHDKETAELAEAFKRPPLEFRPNKARNDAAAVAVDETSKNWMAKVIYSITRVHCEANLLDGLLSVKATPNNVKCFFVFATSDTQKSIKKYRNVAVWNKETLANTFGLDWRDHT